MSLKPLIQNQTIRIDDHRRGNGEVKDWNDPSSDIHIDKTTNFPVNGKRQEVRIRLPINSDREYTVKNKKDKMDDIPSSLKREIRKAFADRKVRESFILDVISILKTWGEKLNSDAIIKEVLDRLSRHFDLKWTQDQIATYSNGVLVRYTNFYKDTSENKFFITVTNKEIKIGQNNGSARKSVYSGRRVV